MEVHDRSTANAHSRMSRSVRKTKDGSGKLDFETEYQNSYATVYRKQDPDTWIPTYWLSFLLIGLAAGKEGLNVLHAGQLLLMIVINSIHFLQYRCILSNPKRFQGWFSPYR